MKKNIFAVCVLLLIFAVLAASGLLPCSIRQTIGIPCPTCGMTRAWLCVFCGDMVSAFHMHPLFWMFPVLGVLLYLIRKKKARYFVLITGIVMLLAVYIIRMIMYFPETEPMTFYSDALIAKLLERIF